MSKKEIQVLCYHCSSVNTIKRKKLFGIDLTYLFIMTCWSCGHRIPSSDWKIIK
jgi:hypothetical protein